jgi:four helix bundle protein
LLAKDLGFLKVNEHQQLSQEANELKQMLTNFIKKLRA